MNVRLILTLLLMPCLLQAQGFAGLGSESEDYALPQPNPEFQFPRDHGAHENFRIEWWYLTANLKGEDGQDYGIQWTLFRNALAPESGEGWNSAQVWMGHAGLTSPDNHYVAERLARGGIGQAGVIADPFEAWIDEWQMSGDLNGVTFLSAQGPEFSYELTLTAEGPLVFHGDQGFSVKSPEGQASYYYSQPFFLTEGQITTPDGMVNVTGHAWLDREWSSQPLSGDQTGWDWISLSFESGEKLMGFRLRGDGQPFTSATWIDPDGTTTTFSDGALEMTPLSTTNVAGRDIPTAWSIYLPEKSLNVDIEALNPQSFMDTLIPYWEGPIRITGNKSGWGYLEMTGYGDRTNP